LFGTFERKRWSGFVTSARPVASIEAGTSTVRPSPERDELLQPTRSTATAKAPEIPVQPRVPRAESRIMEPERTPATSRASRQAFAARVAELELMLELLERTHGAGESETRPRPFDGDPVALTQALHPSGSKPTRRSENPVARRVPGPMPVRFVVFHGAHRT
jgi:hypothetical protein